MQEYERLGAFYLGRRYDADAAAVTADTVLYDAKDLTTHAVCVGMTGSGKTGLCLALLEEAAIDAVPAIAIDPKGDIGNLLLTFPELRPQDFRPWIDEAEAARQGVTPDEHAARTAERWREGLKEWGQDGERIARLRAAADFALYTPGSTAGTPIAVLRRLEAPAAALRGDDDALRERVLGTVSGLLSLLGVDADPVRSREHILLSRIIADAWSDGRSLELTELIHAIQQPGFDRVGVLDLEAFFPAADRFDLAMLLNNLIASPGFAPWTQGEPLDVARLLWTERGHPRVSILSIAHLGDAERMFFVTLLLNEVVAWMRTQPGSGSLRALLYMDEVFGFFPPVSNPPSKRPMLTLLKQARAFGLGVVLATQNPVDLDYKGLSNAGTWFLGRLQTERDKNRVLDGLESAGAAVPGLDRGRIDTLLSGLRSRVFLMHNVHDDSPTLLHSRWALCYLRGPLTRQEIRRLGESGVPGGVARASEPATSAPVAAVATAPSASARPATAAGARPIVDPAIVQRFLSPGAGGVYEPALLGRARVHFVDTKRGVDAWDDVVRIAPLAADGAEREVWRDAQPADPATIHVSQEAPADARFLPVPPAAARPASYARWQKDLAEALYRGHRLTLWHAPALAAWSEVGETEGEFRIRATQLARERRDSELDRMRQRYAPKLERLEAQRRRAEARIDRERSQLEQQKYQTMVSVGSTVLGALFGRKITAARNVGRATTSMRGLGRMGSEKQDIERAEEDHGVVEDRIADMEAALETELAEVREKYEPAAIAIEPLEIAPRKTDITVEQPVLLWTPAAGA